MQNRSFTFLYRLGLILLWPLFVASMVSFVYYPGFMSYDSIHAYTASKNGVTESTWPPMVSYVWSVVNLISDNPSMMHFVQLAILFVAISSLVFYFTNKVSASFSFFFIYLSVPVILGTVSVIWKDVLTTAFLLAGLSLAVFASQVKKSISFYLLMSLSFFTFFLGISTRHNSISAALPLIFVAVWFISQRLSRKLKLQLVTTAFAGLFVSFSLFGLKLQLDQFSLPDLGSISGTEDFAAPMQKLQIAGASICTSKNLFGEAAPLLTVSEISELYDPRHVNLSLGLLEKVESGAELSKAWTKALASDPYCFTHQHRQLAKYLLGLNSGEQFLITDPGVIENEYGFTLQPSSLRDAMVSATVTNSSLFFFRPWFIFLISTIALSLVWALKNFRNLFRNRLVVLSSVYFSGVAYLAGLVVFGNATDARLTFFSTTTFLLVLFIISWQIVWSIFTKPRKIFGSRGPAD